MKTKSRNFLISILLAFMLICSIFAITPLTAFAQGEETTPVIVSVGENIVDQETNMGGAPTVIMGQPYSVQVNATGGNLTFSAGAGEYSKLPNGLTINAETGVISGTCTELEMGRHNVYITAKNSFGEAHAVIGMWVVDNSIAPVIQTDSGSLGTIYANSFSQFTVSVQSNANYLHDIEWTLSDGSLPNGMELQYVNTSTVYINGTPTQTGTFNFTLKVENEIGTDERAFSITVQDGVVQPTIIDDYTTIPYAIVGKPYEYQLKATGTNTQSDPIIWSFKDDEFSQNSYDLGKGLTLSNTGVISGTPTEYGQVDLTSIYAKNSAGQTSTAPYLMVYENGAVTEIVVSPEETVVQKGGSKQFTAQVFGYGDVSQEITSWDTSMYVPELSGWFPRPTSSDTKIVNGVLTVGEDEERSQIMVVAIVGNEKGYAMVTIAEKADVIYQVAFDKNGGDGTMNSILVIENNKYTLPSCDFTAPVNYEFKCWKVNGDEKAVGSQITITADTTITAVWQLSKIKNVEITGMPEFVVGGDIITNASVLSVPANANYEITGMAWYDLTADEWADGQFVAGHSYQFSVNVVAKEDFEFGGYGEIVATVDGNPAEVYKNGALIMVQYIVGEPIAYTITFDANGGSGTMEPVEVGGNYVLPECEFTPPEGKTFDKWNVSGAGAKEPGNAVGVREDLTITAMWKDAVVMSTLSFLPGEGSGEMQSVEVEKGSVYTLPECGFTPKDEYSTFSHWMIEPGTSTKPSGYEMTVLSDYTLTAVWVHGCKLDPVDAVPANCATETFGKKAYYVCNGCGNKYEDENGENVIANFENWGVVDYQHDFSGEIVMNNATAHGFKCVNEDCEKVGDFVAHEFVGWKSDDLEHWQECACGYEQSRDSHSGGTATCAQPAVCEVCEKAYGNALDHNYGTAWESDANEHWNECECGDKANKSAHLDEDDDGKCDVCEYQLSSGDNGGGNTGGDNSGGNTGGDNSGGNTGGDNSGDNTGLSGGAIAGIAVGGVVVVGVGGFAIFWFVIKKKSLADLLAIFKK